jgi:hypothetical protein
MVEWALALSQDNNSSNIFEFGRELPDFPPLHSVPCSTPVQPTLPTNFISSGATTWAGTYPMAMAMPILRESATMSLFCQ